MTLPAKFSWRARVRSFVFAFAGLALLLKQHNTWLHATATVLVVAAGLIVGLERGDWLWIIAAISWVWVAEAFNTAIEHLCDVVSPGQNTSVRKAKDIAAGGVLISAVAAAVVGAVVLWPYLGR